MHIIIGFAIIVGLLAVPATRKVIMWMMIPASILALIVGISLLDDSRKRDVQLQQTSHEELPDDHPIFCGPTMNNPSYDEECLRKSRRTYKPDQR